MLCLDIGLGERDVPLGHSDVGVAEKHLESEDIAPCPEEVDREGVAHGVWAAPHPLDTPGFLQATHKEA